MGGLSLRLEAKKTTYRLGEALNFRVYLDNKGQEELTVFHRTSHVDLGLHAFDKQGKFITSLLPPAPPRPPKQTDLVRFSKGKSLELKNWELLDRVNREIKQGNGRIGEFKVKASYHVGQGTTKNVRKLDPTVWVGNLYSNEFVVRIKKMSK